MRPLMQVIAPQLENPIYHTARRTDYSSIERSGRRGDGLGSNASPGIGIAAISG